MNSASDQVLSLRALRKDYMQPDGVQHVLCGLDFDLYRNELVVIQGPSGSGKTTLLQIAGCLMRATDGGVQLLGTEVAHLAETARVTLRRKHLGFIFQDFHLVPALTVYDNIALGLRLKRMEMNHGRVLDILRAVGLEAKARCIPRNLSGGEKQRVAISRALVGSPALLLADEPTSQLDSGSVETIAFLLRDLAKQFHAAVLVTTHDSRILDIADHVLSLRNGVLQ